MEEAVENGIFGMEKAFHATREDLAKVTRILEATLTQGNVDPRGGYAPVGTGGRPGYGNDYGRGQQDPDYIDPAQFIVNPNETFQRQRTQDAGESCGCRPERRRQCHDSPGVQAPES